MAGEEINPRDVELSLKSSRATVELGEPWEILLHIVNHSDQTIWIAAAATNLTLPAEVIHPAELRVASRGAQLPTVSGPGYDIVSIPPNARYLCLWRLNENAKELAQLCSTWDLRKWHLFFHPGKYEMQASIHVWCEKPDMSALVASRFLEERERRPELAKLLGLMNRSADAGVEKPQIGSTERGAPDQEDAGGEPAAATAEAHTQEEKRQHLFEAKERQFDVLSKSTPLTVMGEIDVTIKSTSLFAATAFGGVLAFLFREFYWMTQTDVSLAWSDLALLPTYVLSAILIGLLVNRVTEARFPLTIKIMDFWGATAFGVLAAFGGNAILSKTLALLK